ncbi:MAG: ribonuclease P protein component [Neisseriaceae bacterium]|nr:ribonuclease P protein component [Neisseriaceae bacterium]
MISPYSFGKSYRLLKTDDFSSVFALRKRLFLQEICVYWKPNQLSFPRLGLVVSKKCARFAHERNYIKRRLREWFRLNKHKLPNCDIVIQVRQKFGKKEFPELEKKLQRLWNVSK